jgi:ceramide synthetase
MATLLSRLPVLLPQLIPPLDGGRADLLLSVYIGIAFLALRLIAERTVLPACRRALKPYAAPDRLRSTAFKVFDNTFTATFCGILTLWAWYVTLFDNEGCTPFSTKTCLGTWPDVPLTRQFQLVWLSIGGYYTYEMIGTVLQTGCILKAEMIAHHVITMTLMVS